VLPLSFVSGLLDMIEKPLIVAERSGNLLFVIRARDKDGIRGYTAIQGLNLFGDLLHVEHGRFRQDRKGRTRSAPADTAREAKSTVRVQWMPEPTGWWWRLRANRKRSRWQICNAAHRTGATAGTRDHLPESPGRLSEIARSEQAEDGVPGVSGARVENATRGDQGLLRSTAGRFAGPIDGQAAGHS